MRGRIVVPDCPITRVGDDCVAVYQDGSDGHLTRFSRTAGLLQRQLHEVKIVGHLEKEFTANMPQHPKESTVNGGEGLGRRGVAQP